MASRTRDTHGSTIIPRSYQSPSSHTCVNVRVEVWRRPRDIHCRIWGILVVYLYYFQVLPEPNVTFGCITAKFDAMNLVGV